jgi:hypothetical protein
MTLEKLRADLGKALPPTHPFLEKFDRFIGLMPSTNQELTSVEAESQLQRILDALDDWQRGVYDWEEVEREIREVRATLS